MSETMNATSLNEKVYRMRLEVNRLRREVFGQAESSAAQRDALLQAEQELAQLEVQVSKADENGHLLTVSTGTKGKAVDPEEGPLLGEESTGLMASVLLHMEKVPSSIYHVINPQKTPLLEVTVKVARQSAKPIRRLRITTFIEGFSAKAVDTIELASGRSATIFQSPVLFRGPVEMINELTRASLNVMVEDLDSGLVEIHASRPIWMMPFTTALLNVYNPAEKKWEDLTPYLAAYVTPNAPLVMEFVSKAAMLHPDRSLVGYQIGPEAVMPQVRAIFDVLKNEACISYVNSVIAFNPGQGSFVQRIRLPRESLERQKANCIDGTVLFASMLEAISMTPGIVLVPGHAFVAWKSWSDATSEWRYLETTMIGSHTFEECCAAAENLVQSFKNDPEKANSMILYPLDEMRVYQQITPLE